MREKKYYLSVKVQTRSRCPGIERKKSGEYTIRVLAPPSKGEANKEVIKTIASEFHLPLSRVKIVKGKKSRHKLVVLELEKRASPSLDEKERRPL